LVASTSTEAAQDVEPVAAHGEVIRAAVGVDEDGVGALEDGVVVDLLAVDLLGRPAVGDEHGLQSGETLQAFLQQHRAGAELVHARRMADGAGDHHELAIGGGERGGGREQGGEKNEGFHEGRGKRKKHDQGVSAKTQRKQSFAREFLALSIP
jgi:hypothetical protein